jgi:hypothetical protein
MARAFMVIDILPQKLQPGNKAWADLCHPFWTEARQGFSEAEYNLAQCFDINLPADRPK